MVSAMVIQVRSKHLSLFLFAAALACGLSAETHAQVPQEPKTAKRAESTENVTPVFEDSEVKIVIPRGWRIVVSRPDSGLTLERSDYKLSIAHHTGHAGPVEGGRFLEAFDIPWPNVDDGSTCALYFDTDALPASRMLLFRTWIVDTSKTDVQKNCGIPKNLGHTTEEGDARDLNGERRWFGGYFTTAGGGYYFDSRGEGCGEKLYTLVSKATRPERLPVPDDPNLKRVIQQAIDLVDSIHYKRCRPSTMP